MNKSECFDDFERVVLPHLDAAYSLARWLVRDPSAAEDVLQDALLRALKYFASFRGDSGRAWVLQIVRNVSYSHLKAQGLRMEVSLDRGTGAAEKESISMDIPDPGAGPEAILVHRQELGRVNKAINAVPVRLRECLVLRELEDLSYKDIAQITGVPIGTVMSRLSRARQELRAAISIVSQQAVPIVRDSDVASARVIGISQAGRGLGSHGLAVLRQRL